MYVININHSINHHTSLQHAVRYAAWQFNAFRLEMAQSTRYTMFPTSYRHIDRERHHCTSLTSSYERLAA